MRPQWSIILLLLIQSLVAPALGVRPEADTRAASPCSGCRDHCPCRSPQAPACPCEPARPITTTPAADAPAIVQRAANAQLAAPRPSTSLVDDLRTSRRRICGHERSTARAAVDREAPFRPAQCIWQT